MNDVFEMPDWEVDWRFGRPEERPDYVESEEPEYTPENPFSDFPEEE